MARTESQKLSMAPIKVKFGDKQYEIPLLRLRAEQVWRDKFIEHTSSVLGNFDVTVETVDVFRGGLINGLVAFPEKITELLFDYAPSLAQYRDEIMDNATREQVFAAFSEVMQVTFPIGGYLQMFAGMAMSEVSGSLKPGSSN